MVDKFLIWLSNRGFCVHNICWKNKNTINKLYSEGSEKMYELLDLAKIIQDLRMTKILLDHSFAS